MSNDGALVERVARAICQSVIEGNVLGGTYTVWTDWQPEARAAIAALASPPTCNAPDCTKSPGHMGAHR